MVQVTKAAGDEEATCSDEDDAVSPGKWGIGDLYLDWHFYFLLLQALEGGVCEVKGHDEGDEEGDDEGDDEGDEEGDDEETQGEEKKADNAAVKKVVSTYIRRPPPPWLDIRWGGA